MYLRKLSLENEDNDSVFLWGARQVGKTTLLETASEGELAIIVSMDKNKRLLNGIEVFPVTDFLKALWNNEII